MNKPSRGVVFAGLLTIYLVWGSTYLAIRVAVETLPPFTMAGARFLVAGSIVAMILVLTKGFRATRSQWIRNGVIGFLMLLGGNGLVSWAEKSIPSGIATLIVSFNPLMIVVAEWIVHRSSGGGVGSRPNWLTFVGLAIGFIGLGILVTPSIMSSVPLTAIDGNSGTMLDPWPVAAIILACLAWTIGSMLSRYGKEPVEPFTGSAIQMLCGGIWLLLAGGLLGEFPHVQWESFSTRSLWAWLYLVVAGSLIAFTTFVWLMKHVSPTLISTYAYVNPIVAVFLGWLILDETLDSRIAVAASTIVLGVAIITLAKSRKPKGAES